MGKIITKGNASREVAYDHMTINMNFSARERDSKAAIRKISEECESFLSNLKAGGIDISKIKAGRNRVDRNDYRDDMTVSAYRSLSMELSYDLAFLDAVMKMAEENSFSVDIDVDYSYSSEEEVRNGLMEEATENARKKAELMAKATGMKLAGVERIKIEWDNDYIFKDDEDADYIDYESSGKFMKCTDIGSPRGLYTELKAATTTESAEVYIEWILE